MKIALIGYGKMGQAIEALGDHKHDFILKVNSSTKDWKEQLSNCDVAIEFTNPSSAFDNIKTCLSHNIPLVVGSTGWNDRLPEIQSLIDEHKGSMVYASNFSIGVNLFFAMNKRLAELMVQYPEYKAQLSEIHHLEKLDAPSGTAISLAEDIMEANPSKNKWVNEPSDKANELVILSHRKEDVKGTHEIAYASSVDQISIKHEAFSRHGFAAGALLAAEYVVKQKGLFEFKEILNL